MIEPTPPHTRRYADAQLENIDRLGDQLLFYGKAYGSIPRALVRYKREVVTQIAAITFGSGALAAVGGSAAVVGFINVMTGTEVTTQGYASLTNVGIEVLTGLFVAFISVRIVVPVVAAVALVATVGAGITAELGARRISDEIDALEVMAIPPIPYLVATRIVAGLAAITPLYALALLMSWLASWLAATSLYGLSAGAYAHYFTTFLIPSDVLVSYVEVVVMSVVIVSIHCYYGFHASGGPAGVGVAVGRSVRLSLILVLITLFALTLVLYGNSSTLHITR
ncbi:MAG TPA: ABC transporter permease [Pseudonocardiaceae bacterium]|jgi:phospholipid/cholesterol/gamma-HCH transport system permease protein|nr:ABC transporter permease [Pseudonocardiaceae bacterium]